MGDFIKNVVVPVSGVAAALLAAWVNYSVSQVKTQIDSRQQEIQSQLQQQQMSLNALTAERNVRKLDEDLTFRVYDAVKESLKTNDEKQQQAASALVVVMATEPLRTQLLQVFGVSKTTAPEVRQVVEKVLQDEQRFNRESAVIQESLQKAIAPPSAAPQAAAASSWNNWRVDVFWCERSGAGAREQANAIVQALERDGARGKVRSRLLPESINAKPGYLLSGFVVRRDSDEEAQGQALISLAQRTVADAKFEMQVSGQMTQRYLSAFVCP